MIDLHCHILPGIDDGAATVDEALELARRLTADGVHTVAATPHLREDHPAVVAAELGVRCVDLTQRLRACKIKLRVIPAGEADLVWALEATEDERRLGSYGQRGTDLLLEAPYGPLPTSFERQVFDLTVLGYRILLAHPERNLSLQRDPARVAELVRSGVLLQVTAGALLRRPGSSRSGDCARSLVANGLAHVLASDAHGLSGPLREPLAASVAEARALAGARADWMVEDAPAAILAGDALPPAPEPLPSRRRGLRRWLRRSSRD